MLARMFKSLTRRASGGVGESADSPHQTLRRLGRAYAGAPIERHMEIAFGGMQVGDQGLVKFVFRCLREADTTVVVHKALHRPLASFFLAQYYLYSLGIEGERAECGVFLGASALIACRAAGMRIRSYSGAGLHLIDSFEGLAEPTKEDYFEGYKPEDAPSFGKSAYLAPMEHARRTLADFPGVTFHKGWIPAVFDELPACTWSFVHLDVDQYAPTHAGLVYFYPRLAPGGVILCDDYGSPTFPGARRAWHRYCDENDLPFVVLDTGQAVILKTGAAR